MASVFECILSFRDDIYRLSGTKALAPAEILKLSRPSGGGATWLPCNLAGSMPWSDGGARVAVLLGDMTEQPMIRCRDRPVRWCAAAMRAQEILVLMPPGCWRGRRRFRHAIHRPRGAVHRMR